jgi:integrase
MYRRPLPLGRMHGTRRRSAARGRIWPERHSISPDLRRVPADALLLPLLMPRETTQSVGPWPPRPRLWFVNPDAVLAYERVAGQVKSRAGWEALAASMCLGEWVPVWWEYFVRSLPASTRATYERAVRLLILPPLCDVRMLDLETPLVAAWVDGLRQHGAAAGQVAIAMGVLSSCLRHAAQRGLLRSGDPVAGVDRPRLPPRRRPRPISPDQIECLRMVMLQTQRRTVTDRQPLRSATLVSVLGYGGLRPSEAMGLKVRDLDVQAGGLWIRDVVSRGHREDDPKTHRIRLAPLPSEVIDDIRLWLTVRGGESSDWLFPGRDGNVSTGTHQNWARTLRMALARASASFPEWSAEFDVLVPYDLRHSCASARVRAGEPAAEIAADLGHSVEMLLTRYVHVLRAMRGQPVTPVRVLIARARRHFPTVPTSRALRDQILSPPNTHLSRVPVPPALEGRSGLAAPGRSLRLVGNRYAWFEPAAFEFPPVAGPHAAPLNDIRRGRNRLPHGRDT